MSSQTLYYIKPARYWMEALPLGNGSIGAMCYSGVEIDEISFNHDTWWSGHPRTITKEGAFEAFKTAQTLALHGKYKECQEELEHHFLTCWSQAYLTFGSLKLHFPFKESSNYKRILDLSTATLNSQFEVNGNLYTKTAFASYPHKIFVYKIESKNTTPFSFDTKLTCPLKHTSYTENNFLIVDGECPGDADTFSASYPCNRLIYSDNPKERGVLFRGALKIDTDGTLVSSKDYLKVENATYAILYFTIRTSYNGFDKFPAIEGKEYQHTCIQLIQQASDFGYDNLLKEHISDYQSYYHRVSLWLGEEDSNPLPTDERLRNFATNPSDLGLYTLLFNYGRYLLIASSREGSMATNLQGIWNHSIKPPWNSNYTVNINTQMNYWPVLPCNMPELMKPFVDLVKMVSVTGERTAKDFYHANGFVLHHNTDIWGHTTPTYGNASWAFWSGGSGWLCQNLFDIYNFTLDKDFLKETAFPIMKNAALFYLDILAEDCTGHLIICPATSPENVFSIGNELCSTSQSTAMMNMIVLNLFTDCKKACEVLEISDAFYENICDAIIKIKPLEIGENSTILEWNEPLTETEIHHRHVSHLYALHPAGLITKEKDSKLFEACKKTLEVRGDNGTGWSLAWKVNFWARLREGEHALKLINQQLTYIPAIENEREGNSHSGGTFPNMLDAHPPFQIDGNFGVLSGICEMLVQSDGDNIYLLPALPKAWKNGFVKGLAVRGNTTVDIEWKDGKVTNYTFHNLCNKKMKIRSQIS
jgi:alpha-L-fucosidase 2